MNCSSARNQFSEAFDGRLPATEAQAFEAHIAGCAPCATTWRSYRRLHAAAPGLARAGGGSGFHYPREAPGEAPLLSMARAEHRGTPIWGRRAAAAAAVLLLGLSHWMIWRMASDERPASGPETTVAQADRGPIGGARLVSTAGGQLDRASEVAEVRCFLRDHADASDLLRRELAYMPREAQRAGLGDLVAQTGMDFLASPRVLEKLRAAPEVLRGESGQAMAAEYVAAWNRLASKADLEGRRASGVSLGWLRDHFEQEELASSAVGVRVLFATEPVGESMRHGAAFQNAFSDLDQRALPDDLQLYLHGRRPLLEGRYLEAVGSFSGFSETAATSPLVPLANLLHAEAWRRAGVHANAMQVLMQCGSLEGMLSRGPCAEVACDPLVGPFVQIASMAPIVYQGARPSMPIGAPARERFLCNPECEQMEVVRPAVRQSMHVRLVIQRTPVPEDQR